MSQFQKSVFRGLLTSATDVKRPKNVDFSANYCSRFQQGADFWNCE